MKNSNTERLDVADGKYTVINNNGTLTALRYGEPWRVLTGDNLLYSLFVELQEARAALSTPAPAPAAPREPKP